VSIEKGNLIFSALKEQKLKHRATPCEKIKQKTAPHSGLKKEKQFHGAIVIEYKKMIEE
jgi:hypothetical protein